ncbi:MAG: DUF3237 domain-containing protein [Steroidobacteraceae bacterium]
MSIRCGRAAGLIAALLVTVSAIAQQPAPAPLGAQPPAATFPRIEFAFEFRVTLAPAVVLGETALGRRQYIPITGGRIAGPKFTGEVIPGGWDFQLGLPGGCGTLTADYFVRATDGTVIHVLNEAFNCGAGAPGGERSFFRPRFEAPKGPHEWLTRATFVATLELDRPDGPPPAGAPPPLGAIRIKFYQVK